MNLFGTAKKQSRTPEKLGALPTEEYTGAQKVSLLSSQGQVKDAQGFMSSTMPDSHAGSRYGEGVDSWSRSSGMPANSRQMDTGFPMNNPADHVLQPHPFAQSASHSPYQNGNSPFQSVMQQETLMRAEEPRTFMGQVQGGYAGQSLAQERHSTDWHGQESLQNGSYTALQHHGNASIMPHGNPFGSFGARGAVDTSQHFLGGMEGHTRLLELMHEAFSSFPHHALNEPLTGRAGKGFGIVDEIYKICGFGNRTPQETEKYGLETEIKRLYRRKRAAGDLLDAIEQEILRMDQVIDDRKLRRERILRSIGATATGFMGQCCSSCCDGDEREEIGGRGVSGKDAGQVLLRPQLKERMEELQLALDEKIQELNNLKHDLHNATHDVEVSQAGQGYITAKESKERVMRHYAAMFAKKGDKGSLVTMTFMGWKTYVTGMRKKDKAMKKVAMGFTLMMKSGSQNLVFAAWRDFVMKKKDKEGKHKERMATYYASKFIAGGAGASLQLCFHEWWRYVKDTRAQNSIVEAETRAHNEMEARYMQLSMHAAQGCIVKAKIVIMSAYGLGPASHSVYTVCQIFGKAKSKFHTEAVKSHIIRTGAGTSTEVVWNHKHDLADYEAGDELFFEVFVKGGILHTMHLQNDESLGTVNLKASRFFPQGFEGTLPLVVLGRDGRPVSSGNQRVGEAKPELRVKIEINMERIQSARQPALNQDMSHAQNAMEAAAKAQKAQEAAEKALAELERQRQHQSSCSSGKCIVS